MIETPEHIIIVLETAFRHGAKMDEPEGARYVKLSETVINQMIAVLRRHGEDHAEDTG